MQTQARSVIQFNLLVKIEEDGEAKRLSGEEIEEAKRRRMKKMTKK
jgi:hypothetical protein